MNLTIIVNISPLIHLNKLSALLLEMCGVLGQFEQYLSVVRLNSTRSKLEY